MHGASLRHASPFGVRVSKMAALAKLHQLNPLQDDGPPEGYAAALLHMEELAAGFTLCLTPTHGASARGPSRRESRPVLVAGCISRQEVVDTLTWILNNFGWGALSQGSVQRGGAVDPADLPPAIAWSKRLSGQPQYSMSMPNSSCFVGLWHTLGQVLQQRHDPCRVLWKEPWSQECPVECKQCEAKPHHAHAGQFMQSSRGSLMQDIQPVDVTGLGLVSHATIYMGLHYSGGWWLCAWICQFCNSRKCLNEHYGGRRG